MKIKILFRYIFHYDNSKVTQKHCVIPMIIIKNITIGICELMAKIDTLSLETESRPRDT